MRAGRTPLAVAGAKKNAKEHSRDVLLLSAALRRHAARMRTYVTLCYNSAFMAT